MRLVYFGTPAFAVPTLETFAADDRFDIRLVVSQPDRAAGRGRKIEASAVAQTARSLGLPLYQPASLRTTEARAPLLEAEADLFVVAAFGLIFGPATLAIPRIGCVNLHASLLPKYRGASPILAAILSGDEVTGVTLMEMEAGLDTGPTIAEIEEPVLPDDTTGSLSERLAVRAAELARQALPRYAAGDLTPRPQPAEGASLTRLIAKADGWIDWSRSATDLERHVRAMWPWPRAWTTRDGEQIQVHRARVVAPIGGESEPGALLESASYPVVACGAGALALEIVQLAGRNPTDGAALARGLRPAGRIVLGREGMPRPRPPIVTPLR